jgi:hypothetical protein
MAGERGPEIIVKGFCYAVVSYIVVSRSQLYRRKTIIRSTFLHWRHKPLCVTHKTVTKPFAFVKFAIRFVGTTTVQREEKGCGLGFDLEES